MSKKESLFKCRFCGKDLENYFSTGPTYCPYCGGAINPATTAGKPIVDSNILTGRALWGTKWSILGVVIGMAALIGLTFVATFIIIGIFIAQDPATFMSDPYSFVDDIYNFVSNPYMTALLSVAEIGLIMVPLIYLRKYRKPLRDRFLLLGWRPYFKDAAPKSRGFKKFGKDFTNALIIAFGLVGMQFLVSLLNDLIWLPFLPTDFLDNTFSELDASITPQDPLQLIVLIAAMMFLVGTTEEFLFRGFTQQGLEFNLSEGKAWLITSLLFTAVYVIGGLLTVVTLYLFIPYFILSLVFCGIYTKTKNLNLLILMHGLYNSLLVTYSYIVNEQLELVSWIFVLGSFVVFGIIGVYFLKKHGIQIIKRTLQPKIDRS